MIYSKKRKKTKSQYVTVRKSTLIRWYYLLAICTLVVWSFSLLVSGANGEIENTTVSIEKPIEKPIEQTTSVAPKPTSVETPIPQDKESIKNFIISEMERAGYRAPLFAVRVAMCESGLRSDALGDSGESRGLWQIHAPSHPTVSDECAYSVACSTRWAAEQFAAGRAAMWTCARLLS